MTTTIELKQKDMMLLITVSFTLTVNELIKREFILECTSISNSKVTRLA